MRRGNKPSLLKDDSGNVIGISLGSDFTSEHEWGIAGLRSIFGMKDKGYGMSRHTAYEIPWGLNYHTQKREASVYLVETKKETVLIVGTGINTNTFEAEQYELARCKDDSDLKGAWDSKSFGVSAATDEDREAVRDIHEAIMGGDFALWVGGQGVFDNGGLVLAIVSRIPEAKLQVMRDADLDREKLEAAAASTGIATRLRAAGKAWYALSPAWLPETFVTVNGPRKSSYPVMFWLNPQEQHIHTYGWFTVEELDLWAKNEGPAMKKKAG